MRKIIPPILGIALTTIILAIINEQSEHFSKGEFGILYMLFGMFIGLWVGKLINGNKNQNDKK